MLKDKKFHQKLLHKFIYNQKLIQKEIPRILCIDIEDEILFNEADKVGLKNI